MEYGVVAGFLVALDLLAEGLIDLLPVDRLPMLSGVAFYLIAIAAYGLVTGTIASLAEPGEPADRRRVWRGETVACALDHALLATLVAVVVATALSFRRAVEASIGPGWLAAFGGVALVAPAWTLIEEKTRRWRRELPARGGWRDGRTRAGDAPDPACAPHGPAGAGDGDEAPDALVPPPVPPEVLASWRDMAVRAGEADVRFGVLDAETSPGVLAVRGEDVDGAVVLISMRAVDRLSPRELTALVAHELAHGADPKGWRAWMEAWTVFGWTVALGFGVWLTPEAGRATGASEAEMWRTHLAAAPGVALWLWMALVLAVHPLRLARCRAIERRADAASFELTGDPRAFADAVAALARPGQLEREPNVLIRWLLMAHPSARAHYRQAFEADAGSARAPGGAARGESTGGEQGAKRRDA